MFKFFIDNIISDQNIMTSMTWLNYYSKRLQLCNLHINKNVISAWKLQDMQQPHQNQLNNLPPEIIELIIEKLPLLTFLKASDASMAFDCFSTMPKFWTTITIYSPYHIVVNGSTEIQLQDGKFEEVLRGTHNLAILNLKTNNEEIATSAIAIKIEHPKFKYINIDKKFWNSSATYPIGPIPRLDKLPDWLLCTKVDETTNINTKYSYLFVTKGTLCLSRNFREANSDHPYELLHRLDINTILERRRIFDLKNKQTQ